MSPVTIGLVAGFVCYSALHLKTILRLDDSLDVIAIHLVGGLFGSIVLGLFADASVNASGANGLFFGGGAALLGDQLLAAAVTFGFSFGVTYIVARVLDTTIGLRVSPDDELTGLDQSQHAEAAYQ
jgi:Amt family ammonium transporter